MFKTGNYFTCSSSTGGYVIVTKISAQGVVCIMNIKATDGIALYIELKSNGESWAQNAQGYDGALFVWVK